MQPAAVVDRYCRDGLEELKAARLDSALRCFSKACVCAPDSAQAHALHGSVYLRMTDYPSAILCLRRAFKLAPLDTAIRERLAFAHYLQGRQRSEANDPSQSLLALTEAGRLCPDNVLFVLERARVLVQSRDFVRALNALCTVLESAPLLPPHHIIPNKEALALLSGSETFITQADTKLSEAAASSGVVDSNFDFALTLKHQQRPQSAAGSAAPSRSGSASGRGADSKSEVKRGSAAAAAVVLVEDEEDDEADEYAAPAHDEASPAVLSGTLESQAARLCARLMRASEKDPRALGRLRGRVKLEAILLRARLYLQVSRVSSVSSGVCARSPSRCCPRDCSRSWRSETLRGRTDSPRITRRCVRARAALSFALRR